MGIGFKELLIILAIALLIFGAKRLKSIGSDLGGAVKGFKKAMDDEDDNETQQLKAPPFLRPCTQRCLIESGEARIWAKISLGLDLTCEKDKQDFRSFLSYSKASCNNHQQILSCSLQSSQLFTWQLLATDEQEEIEIEIEIEIERPRS